MMSDSTFWRAISLSLCLSVLTFSSVHAATRSSNTVTSNDRATTIEFKLQNSSFDTVTATFGSVSRLALIPRFPHSLSGTQAGLPDLPTEVFIVGVPPGSQITVDFVPVQTEELRNVDIAPVAASFKDSELSRITRDAAPAVYNTDQWYPAEIVILEGPVQFRQQTIVRLEVTPFQYNPQTRTLRIFHEMRLNVQHAGGHVTEISRPISSFEESLYRPLLANYEQARRFRATRTAQLNKSNSPFAATQVYKTPVREEGIYRVTGEQLENAGAVLATVRPGKIRLFNHGGQELSRSLTDPQPGEPIENAIIVSDGGDDRFDRTDFILFYGKGVQGFNFEANTGKASRYTNHYGFDNYYFLCLGGDNDPPGLRMQQRATLSLADADATVTNFNDHVLVEEELESLFESSRLWFGFQFTNTASTNTRRNRFNLIDPVSESTAEFNFVFYAPPVSGGFGAPHRLTVELNQQVLNQYEIFGSSRRQSRLLQKSGDFTNGENEIVLRYTGSGDAARLYMDYFEVSYQRQLRMPAGPLLFNGKLGQTPVAYRIENVNLNSLSIYDVSDFSKVAVLSTENWQFQGGVLTFADQTATDFPKRYIAINSNGIKNVASLTKDSPSDLRSTEHEADMIIITHEDFLSQAQRLESLRENWHPGGSLQRMAVEVVNIQDVFDEFSSGMYDPQAIRYFLKYAFDNWRRPPVFAVLFGDGDHDPRNLLGKTDKNWIPTHDTEEFDDIDNRVTDSWYTYLTNNDRFMDMAIGRIPARSLTDAEAYINKLVEYETQPTLGPWRNQIVMVADDETVSGGVPSGGENIHIRETQNLINGHTPAYFDIKKLYLTEYTAVQSASISGIRKPSATEALLRLLNSGTLLVNYSGHGNPTVWAHERLLNLSTDFERIQNGNKYGVWVAATCTFGKFDMIDQQSFSEQLLLAPNRGAVGVLATTRDVFANSNARLNQAYFDFLFLDDQVSEQLGVAMILARARTGLTNSFINDEKFHLYGDPSMRLVIPRHSVQLVTADSIKALSVMNISGQVLKDNQTWNGFNGRARVEVLDSQRDVTYNSSGGFQISYDLPGNSLFRGETGIENGEFRMQFIVPKDITYGGTRGRINVYFWNDSTDGNGYRDQLRVGGTLNNFTDTEGPAIEIGFLGVDNFSTGGYVRSNPSIEVAITDSISGINIAGGIGHKITIEVDGRSDAKIDVTDLFTYDKDSFVRGTLLYQMAGLTEGRHTVEVKAWDNFNNSNTASAEFVVVAPEDFTLRNVLNYPNPLQNQTTFTYDVTQAASRVEVKVYTIAGRMIKKLESYNAIAGFNMIEWDGRDEDGDRLANGVYLYKITAIQEGFDASSESRRAEEIGRLVVQR